MTSNSNSDDQDWNEAFNEEYGLDLPVNDDDEKDDDEVVEDEKKDEIEDDDSKKSEKSDDTSEDEGEKEEEDDTSDDDKKDNTSDDKEIEEEDSAISGKDEPEEKFVPKEAIKEALRELNVETTEASTKRDALKQEVIEKLFPEGIDTQLRDSDGDPITGIEDLKKLENPKTGELFTDEEAAQWLLSAQQKLNKDREEIENYAVQVAETYLEVQQGAERVQKVYGEILEKDPELADRLVAAYDRTLIKDPKTNIILKAPLDVVEFYEVALSAHVKQLEAEKLAAEQAAAEEKKRAEAEAKKREQNERIDFKPNSSPKTSMTGADKEWTEAYNEYFNG